MSKQAEVRRALLCDVDGTLLDSKDWLVDAAVHTFSCFGLSPPLQRIEEALCLGVPLRDFYAELIPDVDVGECIRAHQKRQREKMRLVKIFGSVSETLEQLDRSGVNLAIVTSRMFHEPLESTLKKYNIFDLFKAIVCRCDVSMTKPDPEGAFHAMNALGFGAEDKERVFIVGDTPADIRAGKSAGIKTIGALYGVSGQDLLREEADEYIERFSDILRIVLGNAGGRIYIWQK